MCTTRQNRFPDYYSITIKRPFFSNMMLSGLASFSVHCLSIYGQLLVVVSEVGTFFIHEYSITNVMRILQKYVPIYELRPILSG